MTNSVHIELLTASHYEKEMREDLLALTLVLSSRAIRNSYRSDDQLKGLKSQPIRRCRPRCRLSDLLDVLAATVQ
jgi:hypothetical protein